MFFDNVILSDVKKYGLKGALAHIVWRIKKDDISKTNFWIYKAKYYDSLNMDERERELSRIYEGKMGRPVNFNAPRTFTEKIQWMKLYDSNNLKTMLADKYAVREYIKDKIGDSYLIPLIGVYSDFEEIDFDKFPRSFCLKSNSGSQMNIVVKNKVNFDANKERKKIESWLRCPYEAHSFELHYKNIPRKIIAEQYIEELGGGLYDYKFHCFNGEPLFIHCTGDRDLHAHTAMQSSYDLNWNKLDGTFMYFSNFNYDVPRPKRLDEMIDLARTLSKEFKYVRVDLYDLQDKVLFGEMTFTPGSGFYPYKGTWTFEKDLELGGLLSLNNSGA